MHRPGADQSERNLQDEGGDVPPGKLVLPVLERGRVEPSFLEECGSKGFERDRVPGEYVRGQTG
jgi:hypothetical protein